MVGPARLSLARGVLVEKVGAMVLVIIPGHKEVFALEGPPAEVVNAILGGQPLPVEREQDVERLCAAGVISRTLSRRSVIRAGAIGAGSGFVVMAMPSVAVASSAPPVVNTTRFTPYPDKNFDSPSDTYTRMTVELYEDPDYSVQFVDLPGGHPATIALAGGTELSGAFITGERRFVFSDPPLPLDADLIAGLSHTLIFTLSGVRYELTFTGPPR